MSEVNKALVRRLIEEAVNKGNFKVVDEVLSNDYVYREPTAGERQGRAGYQEVVTMYRTAFPDIKLTIEEQIAEGDKVFGTSPTGKRVSGVTGVVVSRIVNGKLVEDNWVYDALGMMRQLGVAAPVAKAA